VGLVVLATQPAPAQSGAKNGEWTSYGGDVGNTRYSPLDQINAGNFNQLEVAWRFKTDNLGPRPEYQFEGTPLMAHGVVYTTAGSRRAVVALDGATGEMLWMHSENEGARGGAAPRLLSGRGLAYWTDGSEERILYVTPGYRLLALNAKTGVPVATFGRNGVVDLKQDDDQQIDPITGEVGLHATPVVTKDVVIIGAAHRSGGVPRSYKNVKGYVRGFDVRTGKRLWIFHTIPKPGEYGIDTWLNDSWSYTGNAGVWGQITVDEQLGIVYLPVELPTGDYFGAHRPGNGLFGESLVAVDLHTGQRKWHYQLVHHGIWDMDIPCAPILADITVNGRQIKAVAQPTKQAYLYVFDRITGQPVWPIEEKPVEKGDVPGEWYAPTQPFPTKPPPYERTGVSVDDLIDFTPELHAEAVKLASQYKLGPMFTPPVVSKIGGPLATLSRAQAGSNWAGGSTIRRPIVPTPFLPARSALMAWSRPPTQRCPTWSTCREARHREPGAQAAQVLLLVVAVPVKQQVAKVAEVARSVYVAYRLESRPTSVSPPLIWIAAISCGRSHMAKHPTTFAIIPR
jgi:quinoprotein glucose dehydrogenase